MESVIKKKSDKQGEPENNMRMDIRKIRYTRHQKDKVGKFYLDLQKYLLESFFAFEC